MTDEISDRQLVEIAAGRLKPIAKCTPAEKRRAIRISERKQELVGRHVELLQRYDAVKGSDPDGQTRISGYSAVDLPLLAEVVRTGSYPATVLLPDVEIEVARLEGIVLDAETER